jgi:lipoprotein NlpD
MTGVLTGVLRAGCLALALLALAGCASRQSAPVIERGAGRASVPAEKPPVAQATPGAQQDAPDGFYMVKRGDTLYSIALEHGADYREMAQWNSLDDPTKLRVGQLLRVKAPDERASSVKVGPARGTGRVESRPLESTSQQPPSHLPPQQAMKPPPQQATKPAQPAEPTKLARVEPKPEPAQAQEGDAMVFVWPAKGKVLAGFAEPRSKGIDIDGKLGDPVVAAAPGRVTYIGTGIPGLGKLVVIKHDNGFITVYAHNREIVVKEQQNVSRGQKIAELGNSDSERPKLHFQIRKGAAAVDPMRYLPAS